jgi:hypothetical protein
MGGMQSMQIPFDPNGGMQMSTPSTGGMQSMSIPFDPNGGMQYSTPQPQQMMPQRPMPPQQFGGRHGGFGQMPPLSPQTQMADRRRMMQQQRAPGSQGGPMQFGGTPGQLSGPAYTGNQQGFQQQPIMQQTPPIVPNQMSSDAMSAALRRQY